MSKSLVIKGADFSANMISKNVVHGVAPSQSNNYNLPKGSIVWSQSDQNRVRIRLNLAGVGSAGAGSISFQVTNNVSFQMSVSLAKDWGPSSPVNDVNPLDISKGWTKSFAETDFNPRSTDGVLVFSINEYISDPASLANAFKNISFTLVTGDKTYVYKNGYLI